MKGNFLMLRTARDAAGLRRTKSIQHFTLYRYR